MSWAVSPHTEEAPPVAAEPGTGSGSSRRARREEETGSRFLGLRLPVWFLLLALAVQVGFALRLIWTRTAFSDEALYLFAGHDLVSHWVSGTKLPNYASYFSGAVQLYPPIGAAADTIGGTTAARLLGLACMMATTVLAYLAASRLYGRTAGALAALVLVVLTPTQFLAAFSTYDPMAVLLTALAGYLAIRAEGRWGWLAATGLVVALADGVKFASALWSPVVVALVVLCAMPRLRPGAALLRGLFTTAVAGAVMGLGILAGGDQLWGGIESTTLSRHTGQDSAAFIFGEAWDWVGPVWLLAVAGLVLLCVRGASWTSRGVGAVLLLAVMLAPINQSRINLTVSLHKHVTFGAWFASLLAGYFLAWLLTVGRGRRIWQPLLITAGLVGTLAVGLPETDRLYQRGWADATGMISTIRPYVGEQGLYLAENSPVPRYYLRHETDGTQWVSTWSYTYKDPKDKKTYTGAPAYEKAIAANKFALVVLDNKTTKDLDVKITAALQANKDYQQVADLPTDIKGLHYTVWVYKPTPKKG
ncbi:ArnT family glycosyltransferase [Kitasatospora sp. NPDC088391]|uniref:ArnT family glycosyltransferase n=1 Tax=Kitasatospora sp. NPDC088391 TaxID=3364074 RepID=UPI0037FD2532